MKQGESFELLNILLDEGTDMFPLAVPISTDEGMQKELARMSRRERWKRPGSEALEELEDPDDIDEWEKQSEEQIADILEKTKKFLDLLQDPPHSTLPFSSLPQYQSLKPNAQTAAFVSYTLQ